MSDDTSSSLHSKCIRSSFAVGLLVMAAKISSSALLLSSVFLLLLGRISLRLEEGVTSFKGALRSISLM